MAYHRRFLSFLAFLVYLVCANGVYSQGTTAAAQLNGTVRDQSGGAVVKASVSLQDVDTNRSYSATTNDQGYFVLTNLPPGRYELTTEFAGFTKFAQTGIVLNVAQMATIDVTLKLASVGEKVEVSTGTPIIEPTRTEVSQVIDPEQIKALPINGRLFTDFALLTPGVATGRTNLQASFADSAATRISFGGQRDLNNALTVDGADYINTLTGSQRATPSQEAVSEFRVVNGSFGAENGRALGGIVNIVTKSGGNEFHGSIYDYLQNSATNARSILTLSSFNTLRQNQFGTALGGPIKKDKTFFFGNYEGQRRAQSPTFPNVLVSNLPAINALKQSLGISPENLDLLKTVDADNGFVKFDHQLNGANRLSLRYSIVDSRSLNMLVGETLSGGGSGAPSAGRNGLLRDQALVGVWNSQITQALVNSTLIQWARRNYGFLAVTGQPSLDVPNLLLFGHVFGAFDRYNESRVQFLDTLSRAKRKHYAKFGFDWNSIGNFVIWPGFTPARAVFPSLGGLLASSSADWGTTRCPAPLNRLTSPCIAALFWGAPIGSGPFDPNQASPLVPTTWENAYLPSEAQNFYVRLNHGYWGFFAQDQWRINSKLTLNYGMRYDFETGLGFFVNNDYHAFQPRVGVAYSPDPKTVIRAGYGVYYDRYTLTFFFVSGPQRPSSLIPGSPTSKNMETGTWLLNSLFLPFPCALAGCPTPPAGAPLPPGTVPPSLLDQAFEKLITSGSFPNNSLFAQGGSVVDRNERKPYSEQASLGIDRDLGKGLSVNAGYLFVTGHKLVRPINLNVGPHVGMETGTNKFIYSFAVPAPQITAPPSGSPGTGGLFYFTDSSGNSAYHGLTLQATEKAGKYFRLIASYTFSKAIDDGTYLTFVSAPQSNEQRSLERAASNQHVPHRFVANFVADAPENSFLRYFEFSSIIIRQSPRRFTIFAGADFNNDGNPVTDRVGESARNTYEGDSMRTVDLRVSRAIHLRNDRYQLLLVAEAFNVFNRANVDEVYSVYGSPVYRGPVPLRYKDGAAGPVNPNFGAPRTVFNPRQFQFALKLLF